MKIKLLSFGIISEVMGQNTQTLDVKEQTTVIQLLDELVSKHPPLKNHKFKIAVNKKITEDETILNNDDEIALLPPFSGG